MDRRRKRREKSREMIIAALERLKTGNGTHPKHIGIAVRITKQSVAREARVSSATLYRSPDLVALIGDSVAASQSIRVRPSEQRRARLLRIIEELERKANALLSENLRLMRLVPKADVTHGPEDPISLEARRARRRR